MNRGNEEEVYTRKEAIVDIIQTRKKMTDEERKRNPSTQKWFVERLEERGIHTTQSTVSRDLEDLKVEKVDGEYVLTEELQAQQRRREIIAGFRQFASDGRMVPVQIRAITAARALGPALAATIEDCTAGEGLFGTIVGGDRVLVMFTCDDMGNQAMETVEQYLGEAFGGKDAADSVG